MIRAFAPPVAFGLAGGGAGIAVCRPGANNPLMELNFVPFLTSAAIYTAVFTLLSVWYLWRHDVATE